MRRIALLISLFLVLVFTAAVAQNSNPISTLPLVFEANKGQLESGYTFRSRTGAVDALFSSAGVDLRVASGREVRIAFVDARAVQPQADKSLQGRVNYLRGKDSSNWVRNIPTYSELEYASLYPGVNLRFYGNASDLEHDFVVAPNADPQSIRLKIRGADKVLLGNNGDLEMLVGESTLRFRRPVAYQQLASGRREVSASFNVAADFTVTFNLGGYDREHELVIDPVLAFSTYLTGTYGADIQSVATDAQGNIYVAGMTRSTDFPVAAAMQVSCKVGPYSGCIDAFVAKLDPTGSQLIYSTYFGGGGEENVTGIGVDSEGNAIVSGYSDSTDFPINSLSPYTCTNNHDCHFLASLKQDGSAFNYSGYVAQERNGTPGSALAVDASGSAYLTGMTGATFPSTPGSFSGSYNVSYPKEAMFVLKVGKTGTLEYATLIPGTAPDQFSTQNNVFVPLSIKVDSSGNAVVAGSAGAGLPTTSGVLSPTFPADSYSSVGFVLKLNDTASQLNFSTYIPATDRSNALAIDGNGDYYIVGSATQSGLPTSENALQKDFLQSSDCYHCSNGYIAKLKSDGTAILAATYLPGTPVHAGSVINGIALDSSSSIAIFGATDAVDFPLKNPLQAKLNTYFATAASFISVLSSDLSTLRFGSFLTGQYESTFRSIAITPSGSPVIVGTTFDFDFPTTTGSVQPQAPQPSNVGTTYRKGFIAKIDLETPAPSLCMNADQLDFGTVPLGSVAEKHVPVVNCGNAPLQIISVAGIGNAFSATHDCVAVEPGDSCSITVAFKPPDTLGSYDQLKITSNAPAPNRWLTTVGTGGVPRFYLATLYRFGDRLVNAPGVPQWLTFYNTGTAPLLISSVTTTGDFAITTDECSNNPVSPGFNCRIAITFVPTAPGVREGLLTIRDNADTGVHSAQLGGTGISTYPIPVIRSIPAIPVGVTYWAPLYGDGLFQNSKVLWNGSPRKTSYTGPGSIYFQLTPEDVATVSEASVTVTNPEPGGGTSAPATVSVYGTLPQPIQFLHAVADPKTGTVYATISSTSGLYPNSVIAVDPTTQTVTHQYPLGNSPTQIAVSDDGTLLYVGLNDTGQVVQLSLPDGNVNFTVDLKTALSSTEKYVANSFALTPGNPHAWVVNVSTHNYSGYGVGVAVFDDAVPRATKYMQSQVDLGSMVFLDSTTLIGTTFNYSPSTTWKFAVDVSGIKFITNAKEYSSQSPGGGYLSTDGTRVYVSNGQILDASTLKVVKTSGLQYPPKHAALDVANSKMFFIDAGDSRPLSIYAFDTGVFQQLGTISADLEHPPMIVGSSRYGSDGLVVTTNRAMFFFRTSLVGAGPVQPTITSLSPSEIVIGSPNTTLTIEGAGFTPDAIVKWNGTQLNMTYGSSQNVLVTVPAVLLAQVGSATITVEVPGLAAANATINVVAQPSLTSVVPSMIAAGTADKSVFVLGSGFKTGTTMSWNGTSLSPVSIFQDQISAKVPAALLAQPGTATITVTVPGFSPMTITAYVAGPVEISSVSPATLVVGSPDTLLTVNGIGFTSNTVITWNGTSLSTTFASNSKLTAVVPAALLNTAGTATVSIAVPGFPAVTASVEMKGLPTISSITPSRIAARSSDTEITIKGNNFDSATVVTWNGTPLSTTVVSATEMRAVVPFTFFEAQYTATVAVALPGHPAASAEVNVFAVPGLYLSTTQLTFGTVDVINISSTAQIVRVTNASVAPLAIVSIEVTGDFQQTNNCLRELEPGASCDVNVAFKPTAGGTRTGTVSIRHAESGNSAYVVSMTGTGREFTVSSHNGSPLTQTVRSGTPAVFNLDVDTLGGFTSPVTLTCANAPTNGSCSVTPSSVTTGTGPTNVTLTVNTSTTVTTSLRRNRALWALACLMPLIVVGVRSGKAGKRAAIAGALLIVLSILPMASCGGGGGSSTPPPTPPKTTTQLTPAGTYTVQVNASSGSMTRTLSVTVVVQ